MLAAVETLVTLTAEDERARRAELAGRMAPVTFKVVDCAGFDLIVVESAKPE